MNMPNEIPTSGTSSETRPATLSPSLLAAGAFTRVLGALALIAMLWLAVAWAMQGAS